MNKLPPTDREILQEIHDMYLKKFGGFREGESDNDRENKLYVPIDCEAIAKKLKVDVDIIFGRLYYHLDKKYGYINPNKSRV